MDFCSLCCSRTQYVPKDDFELLILPRTTGMCHHTHVNYILDMSNFKLCVYMWINVQIFSSVRALEFLEILFWPYVFEDIILSFNLLLKLNSL